MKRQVLIVATLILAALGVWWAAPAHTQVSNDVRPFMRLKLEHAQAVLEGIAVEDFNSIAKHAQQISLLTRDEQWMVYQTPEYQRHSEEFQRVADELLNAAREKNLDRATLGYVQMTMSCVNCHKYTRGVRMASLK